MHTIYYSLPFMYKHPTKVPIQTERKYDVYSRHILYNIIKGGIYIMSWVTIFLTILLIVLLVRFSLTLFKWIFKFALFLLVIYLGYQLFLWFVQYI